MKKVLIGLLLLGVVAAVAVTWFLKSLDGMVETQIETVGTELTGVAVDVGAVDIDLANGTGQITGLTIANPEGYSSEAAFDMDLLRLGIDPKSITGQPIVLNELIIDSPVVNLEMDETTHSNLKDISDNVAGNVAAADDKAADHEEAGGEDTGEPVRIVIRNLVIEGVTFNVTRAGKELESGTLPTITLRDVGGETGATPAEIGKLVVGKMAGEILTEAVKQGAAQAIKKQIEGLSGKLQDKLFGD